MRNLMIAGAALLASTTARADPDVCVVTKFETEIALWATYALSREASMASAKAVVAAIVDRCRTTVKDSAVFNDTGLLDLRSYRLTYSSDGRVRFIDLPH